MRIAISGTAGIGKSTVIKDFLAKWPAYKTPTSSYRDILKAKGLGHSKGTNEETQQVILDWLCEEHAKHRKGDKIIFDRCALDNLIYTMWSFDKGLISKEFVDRSIPRVREALRYVDIVFFIPLTRVAQVDLTKENKELRETDPVYIREIDMLFKAMAAEWNKPVSPYFARDDKPAIIEIFGNPRERIEMIKLYLDNDGDAIGEGHIINPAQIDEAARLLGVKSGDSLISTMKKQLAVDKFRASQKR